MMFTLRYRERESSKLCSNQQQGVTATPLSTYLKPQDNPLQYSQCIQGTLNLKQGESQHDNKRS